MTPTELSRLILETCPPDAVNERPGLLIIRAPLALTGVRNRWAALRDAPPAYITSVTITAADNDTPLELDAPLAPDQLFRITVQTRKEIGQLRVFIARSLIRCESDLATVDHVLVAEMGAHEAFSTYRNRVQLWTNDPPEPFSPSEPLPDPRTYASDFTGEAEVPADIRPWLVAGAPEHVGQVFNAWAHLSSRRLMAALSDRVSRAAGVTSYHFSGPPSCAISPTDAEAINLLPRLQEGAAWIFVQNRDADTRHLLLAAEWARTHRRQQAADLGEGALESATAAYAAYVKSGSRETLKALAELRKAVVDEGQKSAQRAQELAGAMWKDIVIAALPFVIKVLPDASSVPNRTLAATLAFCAAVFLAFSFGIQVFINKRYFKSQKEGRAVWKRELNFALHQREVEELSEEPLSKSIDAYRKVRLAVGVLYALLVAALLGYAASNLNTDDQTGGSKQETGTGTAAELNTATQPIAFPGKSGQGTAPLGDAMTSPSGEKTEPKPSP